MNHGHDPRLLDALRSLPPRRRLIVFLPRAARPALVNADCGRYGCPEVAARTSSTTSTAGAAPWLGRAPLGLGESLAGRPLGVVRRDVLSPKGMPDRHGLQLVYGPTCDGKPHYGRDYVVVQEARRPEVLYETDSPLVAAWGPEQVPLFRTSTRFRTCAAPKLGFYTGSDRAKRLWLVAFRSKALAIQAAQELLTRARGS